MNGKPNACFGVDDEQNIRDFKRWAWKTKGTSCQTGKRWLVSMTKNCIKILATSSLFGCYDCRHGWLRMLSACWTEIRGRRYYCWPRRAQRKDTRKRRWKIAGGRLSGQKPFSFWSCWCGSEVRWIVPTFRKRNSSYLQRVPFPSDDGRHEIMFKDKKLDWTPTEYKLMCLLFD